MVQLNETDATFGQSPGQQAIGRKRTVRTPRSIQFKNVSGSSEIHQRRHTGLHPKCHFVLRDAGGDLRIVHDALITDARSVVEPPSTTSRCRSRSTPGGLSTYKHRIALASEIRLPESGWAETRCATAATRSAGFWPPPTEVKHDKAGQIRRFRCPIRTAARSPSKADQRSWCRCSKRYVPDRG